MTRRRVRPIATAPERRRRLVAPCLMLCAALIAPVMPALAQNAAGTDGSPAAPVRLARLSLGVDDNRGPVRAAQFMPGMPQMMAPQVEMAPGGMGGGMTMVMTGDTMLEMMAGACTAGLFIGGAAAAVASAPAAPAAPAAVVSAAAVGCGFAIAATAAGMAGMMGWRAAYNYVK